MIIWLRYVRTADALLQHIDIPVPVFGLKLSDKCLGKRMRLRISYKTKKI